MSDNITALAIKYPREGCILLQDGPNILEVITGRQTGTTFRDACLCITRLEGNGDETCLDYTFEHPGQLRAFGEALVALANKMERAEG